MFLINNADQYGDGIALENDRGVLTYKQLLKQSQTLASDLIAKKNDLGGERILSLLPPSFDYVVLQWAVWQAGGIFVPLPNKLTNDDLRFLIEDIEPSTIIVENGSLDTVLPFTGQYKVKTMDDYNTDSIKDLPSINNDAPCMLLYTSGTTGKPKGVVLSHLNLKTQITSLQEAWGWTKQDKTVLTLPLYHVHGIVNILCCALASGATCIIHPRFDPQAVWNEFRKGDISLFMAVPTIYAKLMEWYDCVDTNEQLNLSKAVSNLRLTVSGSAPLSKLLFDRWYEISGHKMLERYGMTETGMILSNPLDGERRKGAVGQPLPGVSVKLVGEQGQEISPGIPGEVLVKGKGVFSEYWRRPEETGVSFHKEWFQTGDLAVEEEDYYRLLGRLNQDIIKTGGHKVSALEIEEVLVEHPDINDATVVSINDNIWGEIVCAAVIPRTELLSDDSILEWSKDKFITHKKPRRVLIVNDFPRNDLGKVIKAELREMFEKMSELESDDNT